MPDITVDCAPHIPYTPALAIALRTALTYVPDGRITNYLLLHEGEQALNRPGAVVPFISPGPFYSSHVRLRSISPRVHIDLWGVGPFDSPRDIQLDLGVQKAGSEPTPHTEYVGNYPYHYGPLLISADIARQISDRYVRAGSSYAEHMSLMVTWLVVPVAALLRKVDRGNTDLKYHPSETPPSNGVS